jgi:hypothetical protein
VDEFCTCCLSIGTAKKGGVCRLPAGLLKLFAILL